MRASTLFLSCITAILVIGAVALVFLPAMAQVQRALTNAVSVAR